jgi:hypothetical protein
MTKTMKTLIRVNAQRYCRTRHIPKYSLIVELGAHSLLDEVGCTTTLNSFHSTTEAASPLRPFSHR